MFRVASCLLLVAVSHLALAQEAAPAKKPKAPAAGRLPPYLGDIVTPDQKAKIYAAQAKYKGKLDPLTAEVKKIQAERDAEIEALLSPEQKEKFAKAKADAAAKRAAAAELAKKADEAAKAAPVAKPVEAAPTKPAAPATTAIPAVKPVTSTPAAK